MRHGTIAKVTNGAPTCDFCDFAHSMGLGTSAAGRSVDWPGYSRAHPSPPPPLTPRAPVVLPCRNRHA